MKITEYPNLIVYETGSLEPPLSAMFPRRTHSGRGKVPRMVTTRGYLNLLAVNGAL